MADPRKPKSGMIKVLCMTDLQVHWANASSKGPRCTKCGQTGHSPAKL